MKKICQYLLSIMLVLSFIVIPFSKSVSAIEGVGKGKHGEIKVDVTISEDKITDIQVLSDDENAVLSEPVYEELKETIIESNSVDVDVVSGSTETSKGFLLAVQDAVEKSGVTLGAAKHKKEVKKQEASEPETKDFDVVVVGAGGAGLSAAIEAANQGLKVALVEKMPAVGGNTLISGGEMNVPNNWVQEKLDIQGDSVEIFYEDTMKGGDNLADPDMVRVFAENALPAAEWLRDEIKVEFLEDQLFQFGGHSYKRALIPVGHTGQELIIKLKAKADELGVETFLSTKAEKLIQDDSKRVVGVETTTNEGQKVTFNAPKGVIITAGGFGSNVDMRKEYNKEYDERYLSTDAPGTTGDGIVMAQEVGAAVTNMESIQTYPVANPETGMISLVADTRFDGAILVNQEGKRFVEELERRDVISKAILSQTGEVGYQIWAEPLNQVSKTIEAHPAEYEEMLEQDVIYKAESIKDAADHFGIDAETLEETIKKVNQYAKDKEDPDFNHRAGLALIEEGPFYIQKASPSVHHTMGGIVINEKAQVLNENDETIPGLYAAGEVTGVIHGSNRLGGNAVADIIIFGRIAGQNIGN